MNVYPLKFFLPDGSSFQGEMETDMPLVSQRWSLIPAGNGSEYSGFPLGNPTSPSWSPVPNVLNRTSAYSVNVLTNYITPTSGVTCVINGSLPAGWTFNGTTLAYDGVTVNSSPTQNLTFTATVTATGLSSTSNAFSVQGGGAPATDTFAPTIPTGNALQSAPTSTQVQLTGFVPSDPNPFSTSWSGLNATAIDILRNGTVVGTVQKSSLVGTDNTPTFVGHDIGTQVSTFSQAGADITITTTALDPGYPVTDASAFAAQQITGTSWTCVFKVTNFSPSNLFDNINISARPDLTPGGMFVSVGTTSLNGNNGFLSTARVSVGANETTLKTVTHTGGPVWLAMTRNQDTYNFLYSLDGNTFISMGTQTQVMGSTLYVGVDVNTNDGVAITVTAQQVSLSTYANWSFTDTGLTASTTYAYTFRSRDAAGTPNVSAVSNPLNVTTAAVAGASVKWTPGHYAASYQLDIPDGSQVPNIRVEEQLLLNSGPNALGLLVRYMWATLETSLGVYDFSHIDADLVALQGKKLILTVLPTLYGASNASGSAAKVVPGYILANPGAYGSSPVGGQGGYWTGFSNQACMVAIWRPAVMARWQALFQALGAKYDGNPQVEMIGVGNESVDGANLDPGNDFTEAAMRTQWQNLYATSVAAMPHTSFNMQTNYNVGGIQATADQMQDMYTARVAFGGPDLFGFTDMDGNPSYLWACGVYQGKGFLNGGTSGPITSPGLDYRGKMPCMHEVQSPELVGGQGTKQYTPADIFKWFDQDLQGSHIFWNMIQQAGNTGDWTTGVLPVINANPVTHTAKPSVYS